MSTYLSCLLYAVSTFLITILLFPVVVTGDIYSLFEKNKVISEDDFIADLFNP